MAVQYNLSSTGGCTVQFEQYRFTRGQYSTIWAVQVYKGAVQYNLSSTGIQGGQYKTVQYIYYIGDNTVHCIVQCTGIPGGQYSTSEPGLQYSTSTLGGQLGFPAKKENRFAKISHFFAFRSLAKNAIFFAIFNLFRKKCKNTSLIFRENFHEQKFALFSHFSLHLFSRNKYERTFSPDVSFAENPI